MPAGGGPSGSSPVMRGGGSISVPVNVGAGSPPVAAGVRLMLVLTGMLVHRRIVGSNEGRSEGGDEGRNAPRVGFINLTQPP